MNSIEDLKIQSFWIDHIAPIAKELQDRGIKLIDDEKFGSSWTEADTISLDFENLTFEIIEEQLCQRFKNNNLDEIASLIPELMKFAQTLKPSDVNDEEIDPYVYVMH